MSELSISGVLETVLYCGRETEDETRAFYHDVLGLRPVGLGGGAFRVSPGQLLLLFDVEASEAQQSPPPHGARGKVHACFLVAEGQYEGWKQRLAEHGVPITNEVRWGESRRSFYFEDPAGNVLEIADGDIWPE